MGRLYVAIRSIGRTNEAHAKAHRAATVQVPAMPKVLLEVRSSVPSYEKALTSLHDPPDGQKISHK